MLRRTISANVLANLANAGTTIAAAVVSVPLILHYVGLEGFGVWTLAQTALIYVATAESGFGPAIGRYVSVAHGERDMAGAARVVWSASGVYLLLGLVVAAATVLAAPAIVSLFDVSRSLRSDAVTLFQLTGLAMLPGLLASGLTNVLQGLERFTGAAVATGLSSVAFLVAAWVLLASGHGLVGVAEAAVLQQVLGVLVRIWLLRDVLAGAPFGWLSRPEARGLLGFSARMQVNVVSTLVNSQTDKVIVGLLSTPSAVGLVGIGSQVAEAGRFIGFAALGPVFARMAVAHGEGDPARLEAFYRRVKALWLRGSPGLTLVACAAMFPLIAAWLGDGKEDAALYGVLLTVAYGVNVLTGPALAYLRAIGQPGPEARYGLLVIGLNIALTIPFGLLFGATGVVSATAAAYLLGTTWFFLHPARSLPAGPAPAPGELARTVLAAVLAAAATLGWGLLMTALLPRGAALAGVLLGSALALAVYLAAALHVSPTRRGLRALFDPDPAGP
jgi:O-antigen/teichoic acid export membrane protein